MIKRIALVIIVLFIMSLSITVSAEEESALDDQYYDLEYSIPDDIAELLPDGLFSKNDEERNEAIKKLTSWEYVFDSIFEILGLSLRDIGVIIGKILYLLCMCSLLNSLSKSLKNGSMTDVLGLISSSVTAITLVQITIPYVYKVEELFDGIIIFVNTISPVICGMYAMGGNINSAIVNNYSLIVFLSILENVLIVSIEAIMGVCLALALASAFMPDFDLIRISAAIKKIFTFFIGLIMTVFTTVISAQNLLVSKADSLSAKAAKMLAANMIPLVGGTVGESLRTAGASIEYLRSSVGIVLLGAFLLLVLPTLIQVYLYRLVLTVSDSFAYFCGCERQGSILKEISSVLGYIFAIIIITAIALLYLITVFAKCGSPLG
ncbi:MAG: hypothetical protein IJ360_01635 [Clostridia bacterium]|nr:hypothetical protein [Clostridia bacterium]